MLRGNHSVLSQEVRRYQRKDLRRKLTQAGFEVRRMTYTHFTLLPIVMAVRFSQRLSGHTESEAEMTVPSAPVNATLSALLALEGAAMRLTNMPLGSSLLALSRKPADS